MVSDASATAIVSFFDSYGVAKGIPTLVIAAASVDDVLAISGFTILLGVTFKPDLNLAAAIFQVRLLKSRAARDLAPFAAFFQGPAEALVGLLVGIVWGAMVSLLPGKDDSNFALLRFVFLFGGGIIALFGSQKLHMSGTKSV